jgi:hypothetical protein
MQAGPDLYRIVEYRRNLTLVAAMSLAGLCLALFVFATGDVTGTTALAAWAMLAGSCAGLAWAAWRVVHPGSPILALSPDGIVWNAGIGEIAIPWREVKGVETITYTVIGRSYRGTYRQRLENTTMVLVSQEFYDRNIDPRSDFMRGPYWDWFFRSQGDHVQIALLHDMFGVGHRDVREPVEARWKAFRDVGGEHPSQPALRAAPLRFGGGVRLRSPLQIATVVVPLVLCLALAGNIAGIWETPRQKDTRLQREERAVRDRAINEQIERHRQAQERMWERFEDSMRRTDGIFGAEGSPEPAADPTPP